jgi:small subunit ribosomal protein S16
MVKIRLARSGAKKRPYYHVVATDSRSSRDGKFIERLGFYNPNAKGQEVKLNLDTAKIEQWVKNGAQVSERVAYLVKTAPAAAPAAAA